MHPKPKSGTHDGLSGDKSSVTMSCVDPTADRVARSNSIGGGPQEHIREVRNGLASFGAGVPKIAGLSHPRLKRDTVASPEVGGTHLRADSAKVTLAAVRRLTDTSSFASGLRRAARPRKNLPIPHHRHRQSSIDSREWEVVVGLRARRRCAPGDWLREYQTQTHDSVSRRLLQESLCRRVCAVLFFPSITDAVHGESRKLGEATRVSELDHSSGNDCGCGCGAGSCLCNLRRKRRRWLRYIQERLGCTRRSQSFALG